MNTIVADKISFSFPAEILKQVEQNGEFHVVGYAATTDFDLQGDIITEEALQNASLDLLKNSTVLLNHDLARPIGKVTKVDFDRHGLLIDALISQTEPDIIQKIKESVLNKFSIRGQVLERERRFMPEHNQLVNVILRIALVEVSLVSVPANPEARAIGWYVAKALEDARKSQGGTPMSEEQKEIVEPVTTPAKEDPPKPAGEPETPAADAGGPAPAATPSTEEVEKSLLGRLQAQMEPMFVKKEDVEKMIAAEVQKRIETAMKNVPIVRKGFVAQDTEAEDARKTFEGLSPDKKLKVALAMQNA